MSKDTMGFNTSETNIDLGVYSQIQVKTGDDNGAEVSVLGNRQTACSSRRKIEIMNEARRLKALLAEAFD